MFEFELVPDERVEVQPEAILFRAVTQGPVTPDGWRLDAACAQELVRAAEGQERVPSPEADDLGRCPQPAGREGPDASGGST
jgi:hypothetical protein